jgi:hypothetical protein
LSFFILQPSSFLLGQEVEWRKDYNRARQEAAEKGRPMLIDFGTADCLWCKQLDLRTFRDPALIALLNERFVPLKVDAAANRDLAKSLHIQSYPTLVFATAEGRILGYQEGFLEAGPLRELLQHALTTTAAPDWMLRDYDEAVRAYNESRFTRTVSLLKNVMEDGKERPVQVKARQLLQTVEQQAATQMTRARQLAERGNKPEAAAAVQDVMRFYAGTQAAHEGELWLATTTGKTDASDPQRQRLARELLTQAREDYRMQLFLCCLDRCEMLALNYSDLPEANEAALLASEIKSNPEWAKQACEQLNERLGILYLAVADGLLRRGQPQQATYYLELVVKQYPGSRHAETAAVRLAQLQGPPRR